MMFLTKRGRDREIKPHITYFREQIKLRVAPKKEVEKSWQVLIQAVFQVGDRFWPRGNLCPAN